MSRTQDLYDYLLEHAREMSSEWLSQREPYDHSVYSATAPPQITAELFEQNQLFIQRVTSTLINFDEQSFVNWARNLAEERVKAQSPLYQTIKNFRKFRTIYWQYVMRFVEESETDIEPIYIAEWSRVLNGSFDLMIELFSKYYNEMTTKQLHAQQAMITELSAPVIKLTDAIGVLPLVGEIDTYRAQLIQQKTLDKCVEHGIEFLIIDLSGVPIIDTMVAQQLFQLIESVTLLGLEASLTGIRPEIAQTAIQLGINFGKVRTYAHLKQALALYIE